MLWQSFSTCSGVSHSHKPKEPKEHFPSSRNLVLLSTPLSNAGAYVGNSLMPVSRNISVSLLLLLLEEGLFWCLEPLFHLCDTHVVTQGQEKRSQFCLSLYLSFESAFFCWKYLFRYYIIASIYLFTLLNLLLSPE